MKFGILKPKIPDNGQHTEIDEESVENDADSLQNAYDLGFRYRSLTGLVKLIALIAGVSGVYLLIKFKVLFLSAAVSLIVTGTCLYTIAIISDDIDKLTSNFQRQLYGNMKYQLLMLKRIERLEEKLGDNKNMKTDMKESESDNLQS